jgi:hypothetical protein
MTRGLWSVPGPRRNATLRHAHPAVLTIAILLATGCGDASRRDAYAGSRDTIGEMSAEVRNVPGRRPAPPITPRNEDSARAAFGTEASGMLLDTHLHEIRGHLTMKVRNPNRDDESPLADQDVPQSAPGPHTYLGVLQAELSVLRSLLGESVPMTVEGERVFLGDPPVAIDGHMHGDALYVPVKAFARPYGAYVRIGCTLANCGAIWTADILRYMRSIGFSGAPGCWRRTPRD